MENRTKPAICCLALMVAASVPTTLAAQEQSGGPSQPVLSTQALAQHGNLGLGEYLNRWLQPSARSESSAGAEQRGSLMPLAVEGRLLPSALNVGLSRIPLSSRRPGDEATEESNLSNVFQSLKRLAGRSFDLAENTNMYFGLGREADFGLLLKVNSR